MGPGAFKEKCTVPSNVSNERRRKAFNEGRRSAGLAVAENPYDNPTLHRLWDLGRSQQQKGEIKTPIPPLEHGETRAQRKPQNPPGTRRAALPKPRFQPRHGGGRGQRGR
jgi:hypothetical protein